MLYMYVIYILYVTTNDFSITTIVRFHRRVNTLSSLFVLYRGQRVPSDFHFYFLLTVTFSNNHTDGVLSDISCMVSRQTYQWIPSCTVYFLSEPLSLWANAYYSHLKNMCTNWISCVDCILTCIAIYVSCNLCAHKNDNHVTGLINDLYNLALLEWLAGSKVKPSPPYDVADDIFKYIFIN